MTKVHPKVALGAKVDLEPKSVTAEDILGAILVNSGCNLLKKINAKFDVEKNMKFHEKNS